MTALRTRTIVILLLVALALPTASALAGSLDWKRTSAWNQTAVARNRAPKVFKLPVDPVPGLPGGFSGLAKDPYGDFYWTHSDGRPQTWPVHLAKLKITPAGAEIIEVLPLRDEEGNHLNGLQIDPEGIVVARDGTLWLVDEIYPLIFQVSREGQILRRVEPPAQFKDRVNGRGFEGVTISPDGRILYVILQTGLSTEADRANTWLLAYNLEENSFKEYRYRLDSASDYDYPAGVTAWIGANGLTAVSPTDILVLERDNLSGDNVRVKRVYQVSIPAEPTDAPLAKKLVVDVAALGYKHEKMEGLEAPYPNTILLINDNDGVSKTEVWYLQW